jgi:hypothetical protein
MPFGAAAEVAGGDHREIKAFVIDYTNKLVK